jgi:hypothetical protein
MPEKPFARGVEKKVFTDPQHPDRVVKVYNHESESLPEVKARFYFGKILNALFPSNFPDIYQSSQAGDHEVSDTTPRTALLAVEKIDRDEHHIRLNDLLHERTVRGLTDSEKDELNSLEKNLRDLGYGQSVTDNLHALGIGLDKQVRNFTRNESGDDIYLDTIDPWIISQSRLPDGSYDRRSKKELRFNFDIETISAAIASIPDEETRRQTINHLERLKDLANEEIKNRHSSAWRS